MSAAMRRQPRVLVVGAGAAGLSAAHHLIQSGFKDVTILEASNRIGGRIHTVSFGEGPHPIELGANWIHGATKENAMFELGEPLGMLKPYRINNRMSAEFLAEDGRKIDRKHVANAWRVFQELDGKLYSWVMNADEAKQRTTTLETFFKAELDRYMDTVPEVDKEGMALVFQALLNWYRFHIGDELDKISVLDYLTGYDIPGGDIHVPCGFRALLQLLLQQMPAGTVRLNKAVTAINWGGSAALPVSVTVNGNEAFVADHVIVTCSLGYLKKQHAKLFIPPLPQPKIDAINKLGFGRVNKIFLQFDRPVRNIKPGLRSVAFAWKDDKRPVSRDTWYRRIFGFDAVFNRPNLLLGWISGDGAEMMESLTDEEIGRTCTRLLRQFWGDPTIPTPVGVLVSRWCSHPYAQGSYSFSAPSCSLRVREDLALPLTGQNGQAVVLFAGEATHPKYIGTTHGARSSGVREAERLVALYNPVLLAKM